MVIILISYKQATQIETYFYWSMFISRRSILETKKKKKNIFSKKKKNI